MVWDPGLQLLSILFGEFRWVFLLPGVFAMFGAIGCMFCSEARWGDAPVKAKAKAADFVSATLPEKDEKDVWHHATRGLGKHRGQEEFATALDDHKDEAFVVVAKDYEDFEARKALAEGDRYPMVTLLLPAGQHWPEGVTKPKAVRVPGWVVRVLCPWAYQHTSADDWKRMTAQPGAAARKWSVQHEASTTQLGDTFGFELRDGHSRQAQLRGLLRVHSAEAAFKLLRASGKVDGDGRRWFVEPVYGELPGLVQGVLWHDWQENEDWQGFANRVARLSEDGVILGRRQLGSRVARGDARLKDRPSVWRASKVPREWHGDMVVEIFTSVGFRNAEVVQKLHRSKTTDWIVRAVAPSDAELFHSSLQDATGGQGPAEAPQPKKSKGPWMPDGGKRVPNTGKGDCMMLAIADALRRYAPEEKASGRSVPAFLATFYAKHFQEYEGIGKVHSRTTLMASRYAALGAVIWNLELHAAAHVLRRDIYVLDGEVKSFTHGGKGRAICLFYDDQVGHYEWIDGDVMMFWATPHQGTRLQGGGKRSHASTDGSLRPTKIRAEIDGDASPPPPQPKQHYFKRGTAFLKKKGFWVAPCPHCDAEIAASSPEKVSQQRRAHMRRWHPALPRMGYHWAKTPALEDVLPEESSVLWRCPIVGCRAGIRNKGETYSSKTLFKVTNKHREAMHPRVSEEAYRLKQISAHRATPAKRQSKRIQKKTFEKIPLWTPDDPRTASTTSSLWCFKSTMLYSSRGAACRPCSRGFDLCFRGTLVWLMQR
ncbi:unnamed protein product [Symbiodinium microadriaticum]|nr:unnamed protein product [Symbiodinium microadriaticum]